MAFVTDDDIKQRVADALHVDKDNLEAYWSRIVDKSHTLAYQDIVGRLLSRGFTKAQIDTWDRGAEFESDLGLYWSLVNGAMLDSFDDKFIRIIDRRSELDKIGAIQVAGVWTKPGNTGDGPGLVGSDKFRDANDLFVPIDPDDPRIGKVTKW